MRAEVDLAGFNAALRRVRAALRDAPDGSNVIRLEATATSLDLLATGRTLTVATSVEAEVSTPGRVVAPARLVIDVASKALDSRITLSTDESGDLTLECGGLSATLRRHDGEPPAPIDVNAGEAQEAALTSDECRRIAAITFACSTKAHRPVLTGVHLRPDLAEATDSYRIARTAISTWVLDVVVPADVIELMAGDGEDVRVSFDGRVIRFSTDRTSWRSPVLPSAYPQLDRYFEGSISEQLTCSRSALAHAVSVAAAMPGAFVDLVGAADHVVVRSESPQLGRVQFNLPVVSSLAGTRSFTASYLSDALSAASGDEVAVEFTSQAAIIRCDDYEQFVLLRADATD